MSVLLLVTPMNAESDIFPIFFQLIEQKGEKTEALINEIKRLSDKFNIYEDIRLAGITQSGTNSNENVLIYELSTTPTSNSPKSNYIIDFLEYIFQKMFDKYPSYIEPIK